MHITYFSSYLALFFCCLRPIFGSPDKNSSKFTIFDLFFFNSHHSNLKFIYLAAYMVLKQTPIV